MKEKDYYFFYDETNHSRKLTSNTINDENFRIDFISVIVGVLKTDLSSFEKDYVSFEEKWKNFYGCEELKSTIIKSGKYKDGLTSFKDKDIELYVDLFDLIIKHNLYLHFGIFNKIEYLIKQMLIKSDLLPYINFRGLSYSMTKAICVYKPHSVMASIENNIEEFLPRYRTFLEKRIKLNTRINGQSEDNAFFQHLEILDSINNDISLEWNYVFSFDGFNKYLEEFKLKNECLLIDREGIGKTLYAAKRWGINRVKEVDSKNTPGVRCADMLAGFIGNFINSIYITTTYEENDATRDESLLGEKWFTGIKPEVFRLYKLAYYVFYEQNSSWYKYYSSTYSDNLIAFLALLKHFNEYGNINDFIKNDCDYHQHRVNSILYYDLKEYFKNIDGIYGVDIIEPSNDKFYYNQKGAICYKDYTRHKMLKLPNEGQSIKYFVLSAGFFGSNNNPFAQACITITEEGKPVCYLLTEIFNKFVLECQERAMKGKNVFPCFVIIRNINNKYNLKLTLD